MFADRVVVSIRGQLQTIRLARALPAEAGPASAALIGTAAGDTAADSGNTAGTRDSPSPGAALLASLNVEMAAGTMSIYPTDIQLRHTYHIHMGDVITAVNGAPVGDVNALQAAVAHASGPTSLTILHNGVPVTVDVPQDTSGNN